MGGARKEGWDRAFRTSIDLPDGGELRTLAEARDHILALPAAEQKLEVVQTAAHVLLQAAEYGGPMMFARIGVSAMVAWHNSPAPPRPLRRRPR